METEAKLEGLLYTFIHAKGFGFIVCPNPDDQRNPTKYYLHISRVIAGADRIAVGAKVRFLVNPILEGRLPSAIDCEILSLPSKPVAPKEQPQENNGGVL
jgi:cold shock CspA family protein